MHVHIGYLLELVGTEDQHAIVDLTGKKFIIVMLCYIVDSGVLLPISQNQYNVKVNISFVKDADWLSCLHFLT